MLSKCPLCDHKTFLKADLNKHLHNCHDIIVETEEMNFTSDDEYSKWQNNLEAPTKSKFVKEYQTSKNNKTISLICHRSGKYVSENMYR